MRVRDLKEEDIKVGMRVQTNPDWRGWPYRRWVEPEKRGKHASTGTITAIDIQDDRYAWVRWDGDPEAYGGFFGNDCDLDIIE